MVKGQGVEDRSSTANFTLTVQPVRHALVALKPLMTGIHPAVLFILFFLSWLPFDVTWWFRGTIDRFLWSGYWLKLKHRHVGGESTGQPHEITILPPISRRNGGNPLAQHANSQFEKFQAGWWFQTFLWANCTATSARLVSSVNIQESGLL